MARKKARFFLVGDHGTGVPPKVLPRIFNVRFTTRKDDNHHKYAVFDEKRLITGSANGCHNGNKVNRDHIVCVDDEATALRYVGAWKRCQGCEGVMRYRDRVAK